MTETPSQRLRALIARHHLTQEEAADLAGIRRTTMNAYCTGNRNLGLKNATRIEDALREPRGSLGVTRLRGGGGELRALREAVERLGERVAVLENGAQGQRHARSTRPPKR